MPKIMHPERPGELLYDGPTLLTFYECRTPGCVHERVRRHVREAAATQRPVWPDAPRCVCGNLRARLPDTTVPE